MVAQPTEPLSADQGRGLGRRLADCLSDMMRDAIAPAWTAIHREGDAKLDLATQPMTADLIETTSTHLGAVFLAR